MIADLKHYPAMKDSGVPWLGDVPGHWAVRRLKSVCTGSALYGANVSADAYTYSGLRFLRTTDITEGGDLRPGGVFLPEERVRGYELSDGDILISRSGTVGRAFRYRQQQHGPCAYAGYLVRFVPRPELALADYLFRFTQTQAFAGFLKVMSISSTIENVNGEKYANSPIPLPPRPEQAAIVRFLDHADRRIRRYIRAKQKLIKLLEEQKQAIIHRAVTRGVDPDVRLKPSGVEWLGDVPEHWEVKRLRFVLQRDGYKAGPFGSSLITSQLLPSGEILVLSPEHVARESLTLATNLYLPAHRASAMAQFLVRARDVVFPIVGTLGRAMVMPDGSARAILNQRLARLRPNETEIVSEYLSLLLSRVKIYQDLDRVQSKGSILEHITKDRVMGRFLPLPPIREQRDILNSIEVECRTLDVVSGRAAHKIQLVREYRTRLTADVVTGKLDVREATARLPAVTDEPELPDESEAPGEVDDPRVEDAELEEVEA